jgi:hypothetical protein
VVSKNIPDEVDYRSCDDDEEDKQRNHLEKKVSKGIQQKTERNLQQTHPFGTFKSLGFIEGKVLIGAEYVNAYG